MAHNFFHNFGIPVKTLKCVYNISVYLVSQFETKTLIQIQLFIRNMVNMMVMEDERG